MVSVPSMKTNVSVDVNVKTTKLGVPGSKAGGSVDVYVSECSPFSERVKLALTVKKVSYTPKVENQGKKSYTLTHILNPACHKVPVLVHYPTSERDGRVICDSKVILQYIDDMWPHPRLIPADPYQRARMFEFLQMLDTEFYDRRGGAIVKMDEKTAKKVINDDTNKRYVTAMRKELGGRRFFGGKKINMTDIAMFPLVKWFSTYESMAGDQKMPEMPEIYEWLADMKEELKDEIAEAECPTEEQIMDFGNRTRKTIPRLWTFDPFGLPPAVSEPPGA